MGIAKFWVLEFTLGLADKVIDLAGSNARYFELDRRQSARTDRQFPVAVQRQQTDLTFDLHFAWKLRYCHDRVVVFRQAIIAGSAYSFRDANVKLTLRFELYLESMLFVLRLFRRHNREFDSLGLLEDIVRHIGRTFPKLCFLNL